MTFNKTVHKLMFTIPKEFEPFMEVWRGLPRRTHPLLPSRTDIVPEAFGELLSCMALTNMLGPRNLNIFFIGSHFEWNASLEASGQNYYDLLPEEFHEPMATFHKTLMETPCGAFISDVITTAHGSEYTHDTLQMPYADEEGIVHYLMAYGYGRKPYADYAQRTVKSHRPSSIKDLHYIDLGAGVPAFYIENFKSHS